jgi:hypothetical protein
LERGSLEICKAEITHGGFGLEFRPVSTLEFHGHLNSGIQASKFQMGNSKPQFIIQTGTYSEYPSPVARAANHFYGSSRNSLAMIRISIPIAHKKW